jgi:uncharacterized cupin superfamily protein
MHEGSGGARGDGRSIVGPGDSIRNPSGVLNGTIMHMSTELRAKELDLGQTTASKEDLQWQNSKLVKKLVGKHDLFTITRLHTLSSNLEYLRRC